MSKAKKPTVDAELRRNPINDFTCCGEARNLADFKKHLTEVHKVQPEKMKGKKSLLAHIDGDKWFSYNWQWELENGLKFTQYTEQARSKDSMMY